MRILRTADEARAYCAALPRPLGLVPTMGALHAGHFALVDRAKLSCASVVASIFVNPLQFGPNEDYGRYPRAFDADVAGLEERGVLAVYAPSVESMYPAGFSTSVDAGEPARPLEGELRPGHFTGVATVVTKLVQAIRCEQMFFGAKDAQQTVVVRRFVRDLDLGVEVVVIPVVREPDGLALSSRNVFLSPEQRAAAPSLHRAMASIAHGILWTGERDLAALVASARALYQPPLEEAYLELVDPLSFRPLREVVFPSILVGSARLGTTRILDAIGIPKPGEPDPLTGLHERAELLN